MTRSASWVAYFYEYDGGSRHGGLDIAEQFVRKGAHAHPRPETIWTTEY